MLIGILSLMQQNLSDSVIGTECDPFRAVLLPQSQARLVMKPHIVADVCDLPVKDTIS